MGGYMLRRLLLVVPTVLGLSLLIFALGSLSGDPSEYLASRADPEAGVTTDQVQAVRHELGLDRPFAVQYLDWLGDAARGDLGKSFLTQRDVREEIAQAFPTTLALALSAILLVVLLSVPAGVAGAMFEGRWQAQGIRVVVLAASSLPGFFAAYLLIDLLAVRLHLLPVAGYTSPRSLVMPAIALAIAPAAMVSRLLRASLLEVIGEDFIRAARGKGLRATAVMFRHATRNAALPVLTVLGSVLGRMLEGAVIIEVVFALPGLGRLTYSGVLVYDYPVVVGTVVFGGALFVVLNLLVDLSYGLVDSRVRVGAVR